MPSNARSELAKSKVLFWATLAIASLTSVLPGPTWVPAVAGPLVMLAFLAVSVVITPSAIKHQDFADGFYYLGFLLTLVALVVTLIKIDDANVVRTVLAQFGLALTTTIVGLAVRVGLGMFREGVASDPQKDLEKAAEELQLVLRMTATDVGSTLQSVTGEMEQLRVALQDAYTTVQTTVHATGVIVVAAADDVGQALKGVAKRVEEAGGQLKPLTADFAAVAEGGRSLAAALLQGGGAVDVFGAEMSRLGSSCKVMEPSLRVAEERINALGEATVSLTATQRELREALGALLASKAQIDEFIEVVGHWGEARASIEGLTKAMDGSRQQAAAFSVSIIDASNGVRTLGQLPHLLNLPEMERLATSLRQQTERVGESLHQWQSSLATLEDLAHELESRQRDASAALLTVNDDLAAGVRFLRETLTDTNGA